LEMLNVEECQEEPKTADGTRSDAQDHLQEHSSSCLLPETNTCLSLALRSSLEAEAKSQAQLEASEFPSQVPLSQAHMPTIDSQLATLSTDLVNSLTPTRELACGGKLDSEEPTISTESESETEETAAAGDLLEQEYSLMERNVEECQEELRMVDGTKSAAHSEVALSSW